MQAKFMIGCLAAVVLALVQVASGQAAAPSGGAPGSSGYAPSPERPMGWRGDGSGRFPGSNPPVQWGRVAKSLKALRAQAAKPGEGQTGKPIPDGVIHEWLVLGPVPADQEKDLLKAQADKVDLSPGENDKVGELSWTKVPTDGASLDFFDVFGKGTPKADVAFAHAYLYSADKARFRLVKEIDLAMGGGEVKTYVNGTLLKDRDFTLEKGWNRILLRVVCGPRLGNDRIRKDNGMLPGKPERMSWYVQPVLYGAPGSDSESENILWTARLPGWSIASPVIAGDRIFVLGERRTLCCLDKNTGKILWARTATFHDAATEEERKAHGEQFKELDPLAARLAEIDKAFAADDAPMAKLINEKVGLEAKIDELMYRVDEEKYNIKKIGPGEPGHALRTPVTDGKNVYANFHPCLTVCYDLQGKRAWVHNHPIAPVVETHGWVASPCLAAGKLIVTVERTFALDAQTGKLALEVPHSPGSSMVAGTLGGEPVAFLGGGNPGVGAIRVKDGQVLSKPGWTFVTPILQGDMIYSLRSGGGGEPGAALEFLDIFRVGADKLGAAETVKIDTHKFHRFARLEINLASPLYHDGLLYIVDADGLLTVVDAEKRDVAYQKLLDMDNGPGGLARGAQGCSPTLGGKYIYVFGNLGTCVVFEPGRQFKQVAKNRIEHYCVGSEAEFPWQNIYSTDLEQTVNCPVFEGKRMYYRGLSNLYCIEKKD